MRGAAAVAVQSKNFEAVEARRRASYPCNYEAEECRPALTNWKMPVPCQPSPMVPLNWLLLKSKKRSEGNCPGPGLGSGPLQGTGAQGRGAGMLLRQGCKGHGGHMGAALGMRSSAGSSP